MTPVKQLFVLHTRRLIALAVVAALYGMSRLPELAVEERAAIAARFQFGASPLPALREYPARSVRPVHPTLQRIAAWISSVGAAVALNDLDADGLPNDLCYVEVRTDEVIVAPVPGTGTRYAPFELRPTLPYDDSTTAPMGCLPGDLNEDGVIDLLVYYWGRTPIAFLGRLLANGVVPSMGPGRYVAREIAKGRERWYTNAATLADLDGDGHADLVIGNYFPDGARILDAHAAGTELMQHSMSRAYNGGRNRLLRWIGATADTSPNVRFEDLPHVFDEHVGHGWTLAIAAADLDGDLLPELYFANDFGPDRLLHNRSRSGHLRFALLEGKRTLSTPTSKVLGRDSFKGMGVDVRDLNGDGRMDLYVSNIADEYALEESHMVFVSTGQIDRMWRGEAPYVDRSEDLGLSRSSWAWDARLDDFDNDGVFEALQAAGFIRGAVSRWPELHELAMGNDELISNPKRWPRFQPGDDLSGHDHNPFFVQASDGRYYDLAKDIGLGEAQVSRGIATADVDGDGRLDFAVANQWFPSQFYRNESPPPGEFLSVDLRLPVGVRPPRPSARFKKTQPHSAAPLLVRRQRYTFRAASGS